MFTNLKILILKQPRFTIIYERFIRILNPIFGALFLRIKFSHRSQQNDNQYLDKSKKLDIK